MKSPNKKLTQFGNLVVKALTDRDMTNTQLAELINRYLYHGLANCLIGYIAYKGDNITRLVCK